MSRCAHDRVPAHLVPAVSFRPAGRASRSVSGALVRGHPLDGPNAGPVAGRDRDRLSLGGAGRPDGEDEDPAAPRGRLRVFTVSGRGRVPGAGPHPAPLPPGRRLCAGFAGAHQRWAATAPADARGVSGVRIDPGRRGPDGGDPARHGRLRSERPVLVARIDPRHHDRARLCLPGIALGVLLPEGQAGDHGLGTGLPARRPRYPGARVAGDGRPDRELRARQVHRDPDRRLRHLHLLRVCWACPTRRCSRCWWGYR